jgi:drug/metabolite transporter (DMT)-like permease
VDVLPAETDEHPDERPRRLVSPSRPALALAVLALIWGYSWVVMKVALGYSQPFTFAALRTVLSAIMLFLLLVVLRRPLRPQAFGLTLLIGILQTAGFVGLSVWALETGGAGKVVVLAYTMPFWLLLMAWVVLGERLRGLQWLAVGSALAGLLLILTPWRLHGVISSLLAVGAGILWAASSVAAKILHERHSVDLLSLTAWQMLLSAPPLVLVAALTYTGAPVWSASFVYALAYSVVLSSALAWGLWLYVLRWMPAGTAGINVLAVPALGVMFAWLQLGERPSFGEAAGMALIILALCLITVRGVVAGRLPAQAPHGTHVPTPPK